MCVEEGTAIFAGTRLRQSGRARLRRIGEARTRGANPWLGSGRSMVEDELVPNYWTLVANPDIYDIDRAVHELDEDTWTTKGRDLRAGDLVAIWRASGRRRPSRDHRARGGRNRSGSARIRQSVLAEHAGWRRPRVRIRYALPPSLPMWEDEHRTRS